MSKPEFGSAEWFDLARAELANKNCPMCKTPGYLAVAKRVIAHPMGTFSLAGNQLKVSASHAIVMSCAWCEMEMKLEEA